MKHIIVFDNNGATYDRFTILNKRTGDLWGCNSEPFNGIGQYCGNVADSYWFHAYGAVWRRGDEKHIRKLERFAINKWLNEFPNNEGEKNVRVDISTLPEEVQKYINQIAK